MLSWTEITLRLFMAAFFGGLIGIERERRVWVAGMRTHMMVCVGACLVLEQVLFYFPGMEGFVD